MPESLVISLFDVIIKILPSAISFIEGLSGNGNSISPEHVPQILSHMADLSKASADTPSASHDIANHTDDSKSMANDSHVP